MHVQSADIPHYFVDVPENFIEMSCQRCLVPLRRYVGFVTLQNGDQVVFGLREIGPGLYSPISLCELERIVEHPATAGKLNRPIGQLRAPTHGEMSDAVDQTYRLIFSE